METASKKSGQIAKKMGLLGIGLCVLCCALPIVGIVGAAGILGTVALYAEKIAIVLLVISAASIVIWQYNKRQVTRACSTDCSCKIENVKAKSVSKLNTK